MKNPNMGLLFYKHYFRSFEDDDWKKLITEKDKTGIGVNLSKEALESVGKINKEIMNYALDKNACKNLSVQTKNRKKFSLKTTYPGLLIGSGYNHSAGSIEGEFKIGFYFDYTTGQPVIPGSSVKGLLRSAFPGSGGNSSSDELWEMKKAYLKDIIETKFNKKINISELELAIFEGKKAKRDKVEGRIISETMPLDERDIFLDAYIVSSGNIRNRIFADDFITPHKNKKNSRLDEFTNPTPIKFLKILPDVTFEFQFGLKNGPGLAAHEKLTLFKSIILDLGIGAKTNVGYGNMVDTK